MIKTILVATDGSEHARKAVALAADIAARYQAKLVVLHVLLRGHLDPELEELVEAEHLADEPPPPPPDLPHAAAPVPDIFAEERETRALRAVGQRIVDEAVEAAREKGVSDVEGVVEDGDPAQVILDWADRIGADLIVMGSRGRGPLEALLMGSVSQKVCHHAKCSCIAVK